MPHLNLFISLVGAVCATSLAVLYPPIIEIIMAYSTPEGPTLFMVIKNILIIVVALFGFIMGSYESVAALILAFLH